MTKKQYLKLLTSNDNKARKPIINNRERELAKYRSEYSPINMARATGYFATREV